MSELRECPFCGKDDGLKCEKSDRNQVTLRCRNCGFGYVQKVIRQDTDWLTNAMIEHWNTRPLEDSLRADLARLRELLVEVVEYDRAIRGDLSEKGWRVKMNNWNDVLSRIQSELKE